MQTEILDFPEEQAHQRIDFLREILPAIGRGLVTYRSEVHISHSRSAASDRILMEQADRHVEKQLIEAIGERFPDDHILSEEAGSNGKEGLFGWVLDPVDGTRNFIHGVPMFAIAAGLIHRGTPVGGAVLAPAFQELYHGVMGSGAFKNGVPIGVSGVDSMERLIVSNGLPYNRREIIGEILADVSAFITTGIGFRRSGSTILDLCWIAEGRFDAMWERDVKSWDTCGASVILNEAGGKITGFGGEPFHLDQTRIVASNGIMHDHVVRILKEARHLEGMN